MFASELRALMSLSPDGFERSRAAALESFFAQGAVHGYQTLIKASRCFGRRDACGRSRDRQRTASRDLLASAVGRRR